MKVNKSFVTHAGWSNKERKKKKKLNLCYEKSNLPIGWKKKRALLSFSRPTKNIFYRSVIPCCITKEI